MRLPVFVSCSLLKHFFQSAQFSFLSGMEHFDIQIGSNIYEVIQSLHPGFYTVNCDDQSAIIGKDENGNWTASMQSAEAVDFPIAEIGHAIDSKIQA